jgi:hypothetical protein
MQDNTALQPQGQQSLANVFAEMQKQLAEAGADIGGSLSGTQTFVFANLLQGLSPAVAAGEGVAGQWQIGAGDEAIIVDAFACYLIDIVGAPGKARAANPQQRKLWYGKKETTMREMFGSNPHCFSTDAVHPNPNFVEKYANMVPGGLIDPRIPEGTEFVKAQAGYNTPDNQVEFYRVVPIEGACEDCQLGKWYRSPDGSDVAPPVCDQLYRALVWVTHVPGHPEWEPKLVVIEGKGQAGRTFYRTTSRDRTFQDQHNLSCLYDVGYPQPTLAHKHQCVFDKDEYMITPMLVSGAHVHDSNNNAYYVPFWTNPKPTVMKKLAIQGMELQAQLMAAFTEVRSDIARRRPSGGAAFEQTISALLMASTIGTHTQDAAQFTIFNDLLAYFEEYHVKDETGRPQGRVDFTTYRPGGDDQNTPEDPVVSSDTPPVVPPMPDLQPAGPAFELPVEDRSFDDQSETIEKQQAATDDFSAFTDAWSNQ